MARGDLLDRQLAARINASALELTIVYPPLRVAAPAPVVGAMPVSPLTGPKPTTSVVPAVVTPSAPPKTLKCLWLDVTVPTAAGDAARERLKQNTVGLVEGATVLARVLVADSALDATKPFGKTAFDACEAVEFYGKRYRVLRVDRIGRSFAKPLTYAVWLAGSQVE